MTGGWQSKYAWVKRHMTAVVLATGFVVVAGYFIGVILFDNSAEDHARERAARGEVDAPPTTQERDYLSALGYTAGSDYASLTVGKAWCAFFANDRTQTSAMSSTTAQNLLDSGYDPYVVDHGYDAAGKALCPSDFLAWTASMPTYNVPHNPEDEYPDPPPADDQEFGPRG